MDQGGGGFVQVNELGKMRRAYALRAMSMIRHPESCESLQVSALGADCFFVRRPCESRDPYSVSPRFWHALCHIARTRRMGPRFRGDDRGDGIGRFTSLEVLAPASTSR